MKNIDIKNVYIQNHLLYSAEIEVTTKCNCNCIHCYLNDHSQEGMTKEDIFKILNDLRTFGVYEVQFTGGEPFIREDFLEIVAYARKLFFKVVILSNILLLTPEMIQILEKLNVECVSTSLYSMSDNVNDNITKGKYTARQVINNLLLLKKTHIRTEVKTVLMNCNKDEYVEITDFCRKNEIDCLVTEGLFPMMNGDDTPRTLALTEDELLKCITDIDTIRFGRLYCKQKKMNECICCEQQYSIFIGNDGSVYPCNMWFKKLGNLKTTSIEKIWNHSFLKEMRSTTRAMLTDCKYCKYEKYCIRCSGIADTLNGDKYSCDPFSCRTAKIRALADKNKD